MTTVQDLKRLSSSPGERVDVTLTQCNVVLDVSDSAKPSLMFIVNLKNCSRDALWAKSGCSGLLTSQSNSSICICVVSLQQDSCKRPWKFNFIRTNLYLMTTGYLDTTFGSIRCQEIFSSDCLFELQTKYPKQLSHGKRWTACQSTCLKC